MLSASDCQSSPVTIPKKSPTRKFTRVTSPIDSSVYSTRLEDTTLLYTNAPSACDDLTACASRWNLSLSAPDLSKISSRPVYPVVFYPCTTGSPFSSRINVSATVQISRPSLLNCATRSSPAVVQCDGIFHPAPVSPSFGETSSSQAPLIGSSISVRTEANAMGLDPISNDLNGCTSSSGALCSNKTSSILSYEIMGTLGRGTYGKVILASPKTHPDGDLYAIKVVRMKDQHELGSELTMLELVSKLLISPIYKCADLDGSKGLVFLQQSIDSFQDENYMFIVLEYHPTTLSDPETAYRFRLPVNELPGLSASVSLPVMFTRRPSKSCLEIACSLRLLAAEISLGLLFLHQNGIVHQDIKTSNIMVSYTGHAVIGDFGAANKMLSYDPNGKDPARTQETVYQPIVLQPDDFITFTPLYAAPELRQRNLDGLVVYDERSDWWSLGVLLYELAIGSIPFNISDPLRGCRSNGDHSLAFGELERLSSVIEKNGGSWFPRLESFLRSLLVHDPNDRLSGKDVQKHPFFSPIQDLWADIAALKYPPCPDPPTSCVESDVSLNLHDEQGDSKCLDKGSRPAYKSNSSDRCLRSSGVQHSPLENAVRLPSASQVGVPTSTRRQTDVLDNEVDDRDYESIVQALPSSASIWVTTDQSAEMVRFLGDDSQRDQFPPITQLGSPFTFPQPERSLNLFPSNSKLFFGQSSLSEDLIFENITISLLKAMDDRDRRGAGFIKEPLRMKKSPLAAYRRLATITARQMWKKLRYW